MRGSYLAGKGTMSPRALVYPVVAAILLAVPGISLAQTVTAIRYSPQNADGSLAATSPVVVACDAIKSGMGGTPTTGTITVSDGTLAGGVTTLPITFALTGTTYTASVTWTTPAPGTATVTCWAKATFGSGSTLASSVTIAAPPAAAPEITSFTAPPPDVLVGSTTAVSVAATDPGGFPMTYAWTATGGTFSDPAAPVTEWTAPAGQGTYTLTVRVSNDQGQSSTRSAVVKAALSLWQGGLSAAMRYPRRVAATPSGELLVVDDLGKLLLLTKRGDLRGSIDALGATAVTAAGDVAYVATRRRGIVKFDPVTGRLLGAIPWNASSNVTGLAWDAGRQLLWATLFEASQAIAYRADGSKARVITTAGSRPLRNVIDVALDATSDTLWVAEKDGLTGTRVHAFSAADGTWLRSMVTAGTALGQVADTGGLALGADGRLFVSDAFAGTVQVLTSTGDAVGTIGSMGNVDGYLLHPRGLAFMANGDLAVANAVFNRVDRFGTGAPLPTCAGDADCDGLPDDWERAAGLDPNLAGDALLDLDRDGLNNAEELALGTDPSKADTDGDGFSDAEELASGYDPLDGTDHIPTLVAGNSGKVPPGLVRLSATVGNGSGCVAGWRQLSGAKVALRDAESFTPSFIARAAGTYRFEGVATCGAMRSAPAVATVEIANVPPLADAGRSIVTAPGRAVQLNAGFSSDANGEPLTYRWEQLLGPALAVTSRGAVLSVRPTVPGYYLFELTATDKADRTSSTTVGVICVDDTLPTARVTSPLLTAASGAGVTLDASASLPAGAAFAWNQVEGPSVGAIPSAATPTIAPPAPGRYAFEVTVSAGGVTSPPARVVVLAGEGGALPVAVASAPSTGAINAPLTLDGGSSTGTGSLGYAWRQVAGPAAGLSGADGAVATVVPFAAGVHVFELTVTDGTGAVSAPLLVRVDVPGAGKPLPVAVAAGPSEAIVGELVILNGKSSTGAARYRWTQVGGPWVPLDSTSATPYFTAPAAGAYTFELVVDDGAVRSAPAAVTVDVK